MSSGARGSSIAETATVLVAALVLAIGSQSLAGAYQAELNAHPDESAHAVSGIMVGEYLRQGMPVDPLRFARDYYAHYPKVAIGHWPPGFYLLLGAWTLVFSTQAHGLLLLMAAISACAATAVYRLVRGAFSISLGAICALAWLAIPMTRWASAAVMPDMLVAALCLIAALQFRSYLETPGWVASCGFGLCASLALLTRGDAAVLVLLPPFATLLAGRLALIRRPDFWFPVPIVLALAGPWYWGAGVLYASPFGSAVRRAIGLQRADDTFHRLWAFPELLGWWLALVCVAGLVGWGAASARRTAAWAVAAGLALAMMFCRLLLDEHVEPRYTLSGVGGLLFGLPCAAYLLVERRPDWGKLGSRAAVFAALLLLVPAGLKWYRPLHKQRWGLREMARSIAGRTTPGESVVLASGAVEGPLIAEAAMLEPLPRTVFLRATKMLADVTWNGVEIDLRFSTTAELRDYLDGLGVETILVDRRHGSRPSRHEEMLRRVVSNESAWVLIALNEWFEVYRRVGPTPERRLPVTIRVSEHESGWISLDPISPDGGGSGTEAYD